jgi:hypothetical protein
MDHWADPWADDEADEADKVDDADDADANAPPPKQEVKTPALPSFSTAPVLFNAFVDDAKWGSADEDDAWGTLDETQEALQATEQVVSETSDSGTTVQADDSPTRVSADSSDAVLPEDDLSTRPSTSPSDVSHTEAATESPRTSFEEERGQGVTTSAHETETKIEHVHVDVAGEQQEPSATPSRAPDAGLSGEDDFGDFEDNHLTVLSSAISATDEVDSSLMAQLFPFPSISDGPADAPDAPLHSTSTRKAWYRLTRKQTLREFNAGGDENNYVRVTWANSRFRLDVNKIVARWTNEDRTSGRGPAGRAAFNWGQPAKEEGTTPFRHPQKRQSTSVPSSIPLAQQDVPPLAANTTAAFNWSSSSSVHHDPRTLSSPGTRTVSSPLSFKPSPLSRVQRQEGRSVSLDLPHRSLLQTGHKKTASVQLSASNTSSSPLITAIGSTSPKPSISMDADARSDLDALDTGILPQPAGVTTDDDEWGEMVVSPVVSSPPPVPLISQNPAATSTNPVSTQETAKSSPSQPPPSKHASPIVRLKGVVSPTSTQFRYNNFVPTHALDRPIGPSLLKPAKSGQSIPEEVRVSAGNISEQRTEELKKTTEPVDDFSAFESSVSQPLATSSYSDNLRPLEIPLPSFVPRPLTTTKNADELFALETSTPILDFLASTPFSPTSTTISPSIQAQAPVKNTDPWSAIPTQPQPQLQSQSLLPAGDTDPWASADFSFFESSSGPSLPAGPMIPLSSNDPFSVFSNPVPLPTPFTQSPTATPSPKLSSIGAGNLAQRRKTEEDDIVKSIVDGLPDLSYMLRR